MAGDNLVPFILLTGFIYVNVKPIKGSMSGYGMIFSHRKHNASYLVRGQDIPGGT